MDDQNILPFVRDSKTSKAAAKSMEESASSLRAKIYRYILDCADQGATDYEVEYRFTMRHQTASARRRELVQKGMVKDSSYTRKTASGRHATIWVAVEDEDERQALINKERPQGIRNSISARLRKVSDEDHLLEILALVNLHSS